MEPAVAARYWRAVAAGNMAGRVPLAVQAEAAERAQSLYRELGHPRRVFSSLMRLALYRNALGQETAGKAALDQARSLIRPDWPAEFRILLLRRDAWIARQAGRYDEALALYREELRASESAQDWRLEVMARGNIVDLLWETGPIEEALRKSMELVELVRARPAAIAAGRLMPIDPSAWSISMVFLLSSASLLAKVSPAIPYPVFFGWS